MDAQVAGQFHCPRWNELPSLPLYMDQVMLVLEEAIGIFADTSERVVTSSMVNNYVKHGLVQAPEKKKYGKNQMTSLVVVSLLKRVLSMTEIAGLVQLLNDEYGVEPGYDLFCDELERMLKAGFCGDGKLLDSTHGKQPAKDALNAALLALVGKLMLQNRLGPPREEQG